MNPKTWSFLVKFLHRVEGPRRLVAVVRRDQLELPTIDAAIVVGRGKRRLDAELELAAHLLGRPGEGRRHAKADFRIRHSLNRRARAPSLHRDCRDRRCGRNN